MTAAVVALLSGCGSREANAPKAPTVGEIDAQMRKVQANASMPPAAKAAVLRNLWQERIQAAKQARTSVTR